MCESKKKDFFLTIKHKKSVCENKEKQEIFFSLIIRHTRDIGVDLIIIKLSRICPLILRKKNFPFK